MRCSRAETAEDTAAVTSSRVTVAVAGAAAVLVPRRPPVGVPKRAVAAALFERAPAFAAAVALVPMRGGVSAARFGIESAPVLAAVAAVAAAPCRRAAAAVATLATAPGVFFAAGSEDAGAVVDGAGS
jgi:hypothetical protein